MSDNSMVLVLSFLPNTTYDLPAFDLLLESGPQICGVPYSIELSDISSGIGGFVIIGELADDKSGYSVSSAGDVNGDGLDALETDQPLSLYANSPLITKPPIPEEEISDNSME
jgi:hypothetical protein